MGRISFERTDAERTITHWRSRWRGRINGCGRWRGICRRRVAVDALQEGRGRREKKIAADGSAEVEQPVVVAGRPANEHVLEHLLDRSRRTGIADEVGAEL